MGYQGSAAKILQGFATVGELRLERSAVVGYKPRPDIDGPNLNLDEVALAGADALQLFRRDGQDDAVATAAQLSDHEEVSCRAARNATPRAAGVLYSSNAMGELST